MEWLWKYGLYLKDKVMRRYKLYYQVWGCHDHFMTKVRKIIPTLWASVNRFYVNMTQYPRLPSVLREFTLITIIGCVFEKEVEHKLIIKKGIIMHSNSIIGDIKDNGPRQLLRDVTILLWTTIIGKPIRYAWEQQNIMNGGGGCLLYKQGFHSAFLSEVIYNYYTPYGLCIYDFSVHNCVRDEWTRRFTPAQRMDSEMWCTWLSIRFFFPSSYFALNKEFNAKESLRHPQNQLYETNSSVL